MKTKLTLFQIVVLGVFGVFAVGGMVYFARSTYGGAGGQIGSVLIWGTLDERSFTVMLRALSENDGRLLNVSYRQHDPRTFENDLTDAIARNKGPDLIVLDHEHILQDFQKVVPINEIFEEAVTERMFKETFIDGAELFLTNAGALGVPIAVDPLVMYVNRDLMRTGALASSSPYYWNEVFDIAEKVTRKDDSKNIAKSGIAFGEYENVTHAKEILATLIMQAGSPITARDSEGRIRPAINTSATQVSQPAQNALRFYTEFANPSKLVYSWNRSLPPSRVAFGEGDVALYVGFASEYALLRAQNPNLNFTAAVLPQIKDTDRAITFGKMYALSVPRGSLNPQGAATVALILGNTDASRILWKASGVPSARRDVLSEAADGEEAVFRDSAIIARGWLDPDPVRSGIAFRVMIEDATSGATRLAEAVQRAERELTSLLDQL
ncbi:MAG: extracellular solute-binding protein [Parcubacteria group bacterium]|nr:extracellular solute-binding protein [Parcubacteria group bacterium]